MNISFTRWSYRYIARARYQIPFVFKLDILRSVDISTCLMKISLSLDWPNGLYFRLNLSNLWNVFLSTCISNVSTFSLYLQNTSIDLQTAFYKVRSAKFQPSIITARSCYAGPQVQSQVKNNHNQLQWLSRAPCPWGLIIGLKRWPISR